MFVIVFLRYLSLFFKMFRVVRVFMLSKSIFILDDSEKSSKRIQQPDIMDILIRLKSDSDLNLIIFERGDFERELCRCKRSEVMD